MRRIVPALTIASMLVTAAAPALACMWDYDTLQEESLGQKDVLEVVTGKLRQHDVPFYEMKVAYTQPMIDGGKARAERYDDLAVALAKLGKLDDAIAVCAAKEARFPGAYTTEANLGTFLAMKGDVAGAREHLERAIALNPKAHFGREKYQIALLGYLARVAQDPTLVDREELLGLEISDHLVMVTRRRGANVPRDAVTAIVGLIRFGGNQDSMHLWFSLGLALAWQGDKNLALRALRRAELLGHPRAAEVGRWTALMDVPLRESLGRTVGADADDAAALWAAAQAEADADWDRGQAWDQANQAAEDARATKHPRKAFGY